LPLNGAVVPEEIRLLEAAVKASEINIQKHRDPADFAGLIEFEEVVFEELVAFHGSPYCQRLLSPDLVGTRNDEITAAYFAAYYVGTIGEKWEFLGKGPGKEKKRDFYITVVTTPCYN